MDHMRISDTEPSSVILSQTMKFKKLKSDDRKKSKIVKRLRRRKYDPVIIERTIGLVLGPLLQPCKDLS